MIPSLTATFLAGLAGSPHCIGMCGGFATACAGRDAGLPWHLGRITTYALLGALAGTVGFLIPGPGWVAPALSVAGIVWFSLVLGGVVPTPDVSIPGVSRAATRLAGSRGHLGRYLFGMATSLLPCGLVWAALAIPVASGSAATGALSMVVFGIATTPALVAFTSGLRHLSPQSLRGRRVLAVAVLLAGLTSIGLRWGSSPDHRSGSHSVHGAGPNGDLAAAHSFDG